MLQRRAAAGGGDMQQLHAAAGWLRCNCHASLVRVLACTSCRTAAAAARRFGCAG